MTALSRQARSRSACSTGGSPCATCARSQLNGITAARWEASGLAWPLGELLHGRTPLSGLRLGDPIRAQRVEADDLHVTTLDGQAWTFGKVLFEGLDLERFDADLAPTALQVSVLGARLLRAASVHRFEERDVIHTIAFTGNTVGFKSLTVNDLDHGQVGSFDLAALEATGKASTEPSFRMASLKGEGLDLRRVLAALSSPAWRPGMPIGRIGRRTCQRLRFRRRGIHALRHLAARFRRDRHDA